MVAGLLVTPDAVAVMLAVPVTLLPLHTIKLESQTPAQISAEAAPLEFETVAIFVFEELKVTFALTAVLDAFSGVAMIWTTSPAFSETDVGERITCVTGLVFEPPPPQPAKMSMTNRMNPGMVANRLMRPPRPGFHPCGLNEVW